ncbi:MAG TPA: putative LPS assembly protein LptD, partial [Burkholderiaceae bacterium]|nr:putative LPS assembly protein LptD [Burkholderiaceae bacterium]
MRPDVRFPLTPLAAVLLSCAAGAAAQTPEADARPLLRLERSLGAGRAPSEEPTPVYARADRARGELEERVILEGNAEVRRAGTVLRGDRMTYTVATDEVEVEGNARIFSDGTVFTGPRLAFRIDAQTGTMPEANFSYAPRQGRGTSKLIEFLGETVRVTDATYTSCRPGDDAWWIKANRLDLHRVEELAVARGAAIYFQGVPIFASPYFQFPLGDRRRTGLLTPSFSVNSKLGPEVEVPWYWDIAPNRDLTLAPRFMSRRGVLLQSEARYLEPRFRGILDFDIIPNDRVDGGSREHVSWRHDYVHSSGVASGINYNQVSDDRFFVDFSRTIVGAATAVLPQEAFVS